jgi:hypothetical protein
MKPLKIVLISGIPDPQAYGANILTRSAAIVAKKRAHKTYMIYEIIYAPAPSFSPPNFSDHVLH